MVTQHGIDAIRCQELTEIEHGRYHLLRIDVLHVACEDYHVGSLCIDAVDELLYHGLARTRHRTHMSIGELYDTITIEGFRQVGRGIFDMVYHQGLEATRHAIAHQCHLQCCQQDADNRSVALVGQELATEQKQQEGNNDEPHGDEERYGKMSYHYYRG